MAKVDLPDIGSLGNPSSARQAINQNFQTIEEAFEDFLNRKGLTPNQMEADIDMGSHKLLNVADPVNDGDAVNKRSIRDLMEEFASEIIDRTVFGEAVVDQFTATAGQSAFSLSAPPGSLNNVEVYVDGIAKRPTADFTLSGPTLQTMTLMVAATLGQKVMVRYVRALPSGQQTANNVIYIDGVSSTSMSVQQFLDILQSPTGLSKLGFTQSGTGAVIRNSQDKVRESVSVLDFGADPTGLADSSTAFANASTRAGTDGEVIIPAGTYKITATNIGSASTSWVRKGQVTLTGGGTLTWPWSRTPRKHRFGNPFGQEQLIDIQDPNDPAYAHLYMFRTIAPGTDRSGNIYARLNNTGDAGTSAVMVDAFHTGPNTAGFPGAITSYSTASRLNGAAVLSSYISVHSPANNIAGQEWNSGLTYAQEVNFGNRWGEFGLQRDYTASKWVGGTLYCADVLPAPDGGGTAYNYHAQYGVLFTRATSGGNSRKLWIPVYIGQDSIPAGGIGIHTRGSTVGADRPLAVMEAALNWDFGIDMSKATFNTAAFKGFNQHFSNAAGTTQGQIYCSGNGEITVQTNMANTGGVTQRFFQFRENGSFNILTPNPPGTSNAVGKAGDIQWDSNYIYVCVATNTWKRSALSTW